MKSRDQSFSKSIEIVYLLCVFVHVFYIIFGLMNGATLIFLYNCFSAILFIGLIKLNRSGKHFLAAIISVIEIISYSILMVYMFGQESRFHVVLVTTMLMVFTLDSTVKAKHKTILASICAILYIIIESELLYFTTKYAISDLSMNILKIVNSTSVVIPIIYIMTLYDGFRYSLEEEKESVKSLVSSMKNIALETVEKSNEIENKINLINSSVEESSLSINTIDAMSKQVLSSQQNNAAIVSNVVLESDKLNEEINKLQATTEEIIFKNTSVSDSIKKGSLKMEDVNSNVNVLKENTYEINRFMEELFDLINQINDSLSIISTVAESTNMLSLNASIESSRSSENSSGFGVIASEIRALADRSKTSSKEITETVEKVLERINSIIKSTKNNNNVISNVFYAVEDANDTFKGMLEAVHSISNSIEDINELSLNQSSSIEKLLNVSNKLNETIESTLNACEEITNEISSQVVAEDSIKDSISSLSSIATELKNKVKEI